MRRFVLVVVNYLQGGMQQGVCGTLQAEQLTTQAHLAPVTSMQAAADVVLVLMQNGKLQRATHNIMAYRIRAGNDTFLQVRCQLHGAWFHSQKRRRVFAACWLRSKKGSCRTVMTTVKVQRAVGCCTCCKLPMPKMLLWWSPAGAPQEL